MGVGGGGRGRGRNGGGRESGHIMSGLAFTRLHVQASAVDEQVSNQNETHVLSLASGWLLDHLRGGRIQSLKYEGYGGWLFWTKTNKKHKNPDRSLSSPRTDMPTHCTKSFSQTACHFNLELKCLDAL